MTADAAALYQQRILDHGRRPRNRRALAGASEARRDNPLCGDRLTVYARLDGDVIVEAAFEGDGCAIAIASASMMTALVAGRTREDVGRLDAAFERLVTVGVPAAELGELEAFAGIRAFPVRRKCATLAWEALRAALG